MALIALITLNVLAVILESVQSIGRPYAVWFSLFETVSVAIFTVEYAARVWAIVDHAYHAEYRHPLWGRLRFMLTPLALLDLLVILPYYLAFVVGIDLRFMRVLRLLRIFKLTRYSAAMTLLMTVLRREAQTIGAALFVLVLLIVVSACLTFIAEHEAQPEHFASIPAAMWWAVVTMTTVGYGDVIPVTTMGKFFASLISILSMGMVAMPAGLLASGFVEAIRERREQFTEMVEDAIEDGVIDDAEHELLNHMRVALGMSADEAQQILNRSRRDSERRMADLEFVARVEDAVANGQVTEAEAHAIEEAGLSLGVGRDQAHRFMAIFKKHLHQSACPHCGEPLQKPAGHDHTPPLK